MAKQITEKSTKQEILEAYNNVLSELQTKATAKFDPAVQAQEKKISELKSKVESVDVTNFNSLVGELESTLKTITENLNVYNEIKDAIKVKEAELKEMFEIEKAAYTLSALVNSQAELREKFNTEMAEKKAELDQLIKTTQEEMKVLKDKTVAEVKKIDEDAKLARKKEEDTYTYEITRKRKIETDKFNDEMDIKRKEFETKVKDLEAREKNLKTLETTIEQLKTEKDEAIKVASAEAEKKAKTAYTFETNYLKKDYEGKIALLESKIETLTLSLADAKQANVTLSTKLDDAYARIETMASKTVEGANSRDMINTLKGALNDKNVNGK